MSAQKKVENPKKSSISITPRSPKQTQYLDMIDSNFVTICVGPAGCGKTFLACLKAMKAFAEYKVSKIVLVRPAIEAGESIGFLPGTLEEKMDPYMAPLFDAFNEYWMPETITKMIEDKEIEIVPLAFMRGRTFRNAFIIVDEAQNITAEQMKMLLTRFGEDCKMVVAGDKTQSDLPYKDVSGLDAALRLSKYGIDGFDHFEFSNEDVVRHRVVRDILEAWDKLS
ncbi:MAG TPA: PhoH family protein [Methanosarcina sp.]|nr:PhoH family protein [Methanosarcina sp.]